MLDTALGFKPAACDACLGVLFRSLRRLRINSARPGADPSRSTWTVIRPPGAAESRRVVPLWVTAQLWGFGSASLGPRWPRRRHEPRLTAAQAPGTQPPAPLDKFVHRIGGHPGIAEKASRGRRLDDEVLRPRRKEPALYRLRAGSSAAFAWSVAARRAGLGWARLGAANRRGRFQFRRRDADQQKPAGLL